MADEIVKKPGFKTTEWWATAIGSLATLFMTSGAVSETSEVYRVAGLIVTGAVLLGYQVSRGMAKKAGS